MVKAASGSLTGVARVRVVPDLPWSFDFEGTSEVPPPHWVNATGKFAVRDLEGSKVLVKLAENPFAFAKRCRPFMGGTEYSNYTVEADVRAMERRRQMGDIGIVASRTSWCCSGRINASNSSRGSRRLTGPRGSSSRGRKTPGTL